MRKRKCSSCEKLLPLSHYYYDKRSNRHIRQCKTCKHERRLAKVNACPYEYLNRAGQQLKNSRGRRNPDVVWDIEYEYLHRIFDKQEGKCAYTGKTMTNFRDGSGRRNPDNISIDRIDPDKGYEEGNIQLICHNVNMMKWILTDAEFKTICRQVANRYPE